MKVEDVKIAILQMEGTNCEQEMFDAFAKLGARPEFVHLNQLTSTDMLPEYQRKLMDYQVLMLPGGFSAGDYIRAGAIFAARIKSKLESDLSEFIEEGRAVGGICNGFQILVELGALPGNHGPLADRPTIALTTNDSNRFECRPTLLRHENKGNCHFTGLLEQDTIIMTPSAHAEGKLMFPRGEEERMFKELTDNDQVVFRYVDTEGNYGGYPFNPNGSPFNIAGICNPEGNVFGMMPHPERVFSSLNHNDWTRNPALNHDGKTPNPSLDQNDGTIDPALAQKPVAGHGKALFESVIESICRRF